MGRKNVLTGAILLLIVLLWQPMASAAVVNPPEEVYVGDYANVLSDATEQYIIEKNEELNRATGAQIVIVTVDFLDGIPIEDYAYTIFNQWGIGDAEKDNGLLLLLAIGEDDYWVMQGKGLEGVLSSGTLGDYLTEYLEPDFIAGHYDAGVKKVFRSFYDWFADYYQLDGVAAVKQETTSRDSQPLVILFVIILIFLFLGFKGQNSRNRNIRYPTARNSGAPYYRDYRNDGAPPLAGGGVYMPPRKPSTFKKQKTNAGSWFGGGSSSGGGAGRTANRSKNSCKSSNASFGKGSTRGGGAGRSSGGSGIAPKSAVGSRGASSNKFGGGSSRGGGAGRSSGGASGAGRKSGGSYGGGSTRGGGAGRR